MRPDAPATPTPPASAIRVARPSSLPPADARLVVVEASAGTGKTFFLEHRVVDLILGGAELGQILLVTFTDKAVAELRMRIRDLLDRLARLDHDTAAADDAACWTIDDAARRRLRAAIAGFDHAPIFTIHGFCHRTLVEDAFAAQRLFEQRQVADEIAFDAAFVAVLRERFARTGAERELLAASLETGRTVDQLRNLLLACARAGVEARVRRRFDPDAVAALARRLRDQLGTPAARDAVAEAVRTRWTADWLQKIAAALDATPADAAPAHQLAMLDRVRDTAGKLAKYADKRPELADTLRAAARAVPLDEAVAATLLPPLLDRIAADKAEHGLFDYDDMLRLVWRALDDGPRRELIAARLRERTPWAMIDEFQDTDPIQWKIFRTVWAHPDARGLTIVGDPKQAIYGFRGADVHTYLAARDELLAAGATRVPLDVNRRSTAALVGAVNDLLLGGARPLLDQAITYDTPVRASGDITCDERGPTGVAGGAPVTVLALGAAPEGKGQAEAVRAAVATAIGDTIDALRAAPPSWQVRGVAQPFALGQIMVLTRSNRDSAEIASALRARGLPCALVEPDRLFETREAAELHAVLAAIAAPRDRSLRLRALRTRFFDVPWHDLQRAVDAPDHHPAIARIFDWAQLAARRAYEPLFRRLVEDSRYAERALVLGGGERALTNTWHLIELLLAEVARSRSDLHELVVQLRRWIADDTDLTDERDVQRAETDGDAIRVLTIHKAKGLEAPYVFLYGGTSPGKSSRVHLLHDHGARAIIVGTPDAETKPLLDAELDGENQRLAYVALTRAQLRLYLPRYNGVAKHAAYEPVERCLADVAALPSPTFAHVEVAVGAPAAPPPPPDALAGWTAEPPPPPDVRAPLAAERRGLAILSYTRLAHDLDVAAMPASDAARVALDPAEFDLDDAGRGPGDAGDPPELGPDDLPPGASSGLVLHEILERAELDAVRAAPDAAAWAAEPEVVALVAAAGRGHGIAARHLPHAARLAHAALTTPLALTTGDALPPLVAATALAREVEFAYPIPGAPGLVKGYIDALVAFDDELWVLDYKSDLLAGPDLAAAAQRRVDEHYVIQARLYAIAADRLRGPRRLAGLLFAFIRHGVVVPLRIGDATLATWTQWLAQIARPAAGAQLEGAR